MAFVEAEITIDAAAREVYELAKEQERFPEFMPDVEAVIVLERSAGRIVTRWKTLVEEAPIEWTEEDRFDDDALRVDYKLIEGDLDTFEGTWTFVEDAGGTLVYARQGKRLLREATPGATDGHFRAPRSLRDVEASVLVKVLNPIDGTELA